MHDEANSRFSQFYELALKKNEYVPTWRQARVFSTTNIGYVIL